MNIDDIVYGNPIHTQVKYLSETTYADKFFEQLSKFSFPASSSKAVREELNQLKDNVDALAADESIIKRYRMYDQNMYLFFKKTFVEAKLDDKAMLVVDDLMADIYPLIYKLKYHFNRPRPYQLAKAYSLTLFPHKSFSVDSPSYPSGQTLISFVICHVMGNYYPKLFEYFDNLAKDIENSRVYLGANYPSDNDTSLFIADLIISDRIFKEKYQL